MQLESPIRRRIPRMAAAIAGAAVALLSFAGPASAAPAAPAAPRTAADVGYLVFCTGDVYGEGACYRYSPQLSNTVCSGTGRSFHSGANFSTQNQWVFTSGSCGSGYKTILYAGYGIDGFPIGSFSHT